MDNKDTRLLALMEKFEQGLATEAEMLELDAWFNSMEDNPSVLANLNGEEQLKAKSALLMRINTRVDYELETTHYPRTRKPVALWARIMVAASLLLFLSFGTYFLIHRGNPIEQTANNLSQDFQPGSNKAILTLAGGRKIILDNSKNGKLAMQGNTVVIKTGDGKVIYDTDGSDEAEQINTMTTPKGGEYHLVLADGTGVWLNAASSITYPAAFSGKDRYVETTGQVYFEVAHNASKPFRVKTNGQTVEVLGTHFDVNAYTGDVIKTTLLQGSVAVLAKGIRKVIRPGDQAAVSGSTIKIGQVDTDEIMAWKDGFFDFTDADIKTVMQEFSRWYDLDIVFDGPVTNEVFTGRLPRSWSFAKVMKLMKPFKSTHLTIEGRRIMVRQ